MMNYSKEDILKEVQGIVLPEISDIVKVGTSEYTVVNSILEEMADSKFLLNKAIQEGKPEKAEVHRAELRSLEASIKLRIAAVKTFAGESAKQTVIKVLQVAVKFLFSTLLTLA